MMGSRIVCYPCWLKHVCEYYNSYFMLDFWYFLHIYIECKVIRSQTDVFYMHVIEEVWNYPFCI